MKAFIIVILLFISCDSLAAENYLYLKIGNLEKIKVTTNDLEKMPSHTIITSTNFTKKSVFTGVDFRDFSKKYHINSDKIRVFAWDDYSYSIPTNEMIKYGVIIAYKKNGAYIPMSDLGPYAIIYPRDDHPELINLNVNARTVWQIKEIVVK